MMLDKKTEALFKDLEPLAEVMTEQSEAFYAQATANDMNAISWMLDAAKKEGLLVEVIWSFATDVKTHTIQTACATALSEWDI